MDNVTFQDFPQIGGGTETFAIIAHPDGSFTSMLKSTYDAQVATQPTA